MGNNITPAEIATIYADYLKQFMKRADVQNGVRVSYHDNQDPDAPLKPENWVNLGDARVTTGFCVSFSNAIFKDKLFQTLLQSRGALAKVISIDIKEQFYGHCKPSYVANKWHTAILVRDNNVNLILDPTCAQFGNQFVGKFVWDLMTWMKTFRSSNDNHRITGFFDDVLSFNPVKTQTSNYDQAMMKVVNQLHDIATITDEERKMLADFFLKGMEVLNNKIEIGNLTDTDFQYMDNIHRISKQMMFKIASEPQYCILSFETKDACKTWLKRYVDVHKHILPYYLLLSNSIEDACYYNGYNPENLNTESTKPETYLVLKFVSVNGCDTGNILRHASMFVPYGIRAEIKNVYNGGETLPESSYGIKKTTNTIFAELSMN